MQVWILENVWILHKASDFLKGGKFMGRGSYNAADWNRLKGSRGISASSTADDIFSKNKANEKYLPQFINMRESRDSEDSPESTPIIIGFDSTGSMGYLAAEIAKNSLNKTATMILEKRPVPDPHIMCAAFTAPNAYSYPALQVTQFEADIRVVEQLLDFQLDGGNRYSYDALVWYFALKHTSTDCFEKRGKKGFIFCIGDEVGSAVNETILNSEEIKSVFGDKAEAEYTTPGLARKVGERYEVFHIITGNHVDTSLKSWEPLLPGRNAVIKSENIHCLAEVMISIMQLCAGMSKKDVEKQWDDKTRSVVEYALSTINIAPEKQNIFSCLFDKNKK